jgi:hypothetical protein
MPANSLYIKLKAQFEPKTLRTDEPRKKIPCLSHFLRERRTQFQSSQNKNLKNCSHFRKKKSKDQTLNSKFLKKKLET